MTPGPRLGAWVKLPTPETVELLAVAGLDFVVVDDEHATIDIRTVSTMISTALGCGIEPYVRVAGVSPRDVQPALDAGAHGLFVPQVGDASDAQRAVNATRFPPLGRRGASNSGRAGHWGVQSLAEYIEAGSDVKLILQTETPGALAAIVAIAQTPGVDGVFIGPSDLAVSMGVELGDPAARALIVAAEQSCAIHDIPVGTTAADDAVDLVGRGYRFLVLGTDAGLLRSGASAAVARARARSEEADVG